MPITDLSTGDDWQAWLQNMAGGGQGVGGLEGDVGYPSPGFPGPGPETRGYVNPPTIEGHANQLVPGARAPMYVNPQSLQDILAGRSAISPSPGQPALPGAGAIAGGGAGGGGVPIPGGLAAGGVGDPVARLRGLGAAGLLGMGQYGVDFAQRHGLMQALFPGFTGAANPPGPAAPSTAAPGAMPARPYTPTPPLRYNPLAGQPTGVPYQAPAAQPAGPMDPSIIARQAIARQAAGATAPGRPAPVAPAPVPPTPARSPNLGYYAPTSGNARGATYTPYLNPNDPRIYRGPLSMFGAG
jgi:hypothetical protein